MQSINYNGGISTADYQPFRVIIRDANDNDDSIENRNRGHYNTPREEEFDVLRYLVRIVEHNTTDRSTITNYKIGTMGELLAISDTNGEKFRYRYDHSGNRLSIIFVNQGSGRSGMMQKRTLSEPLILPVMICKQNGIHKAG